MTNFSRVCKIKSLEILNLSTNNIVEIPKNICNLQKIVYLNLSNNKILFLPKELLKCTKLKKLILYNNQIQRIPIELLGILSNLDCLDLKQNLLEIYRTSTELGLNELVKELGFKLSVDDIEINKVYQFLDSKPISFNFENLRKCRITSLTEHIISEQELLNKINNCTFNKFNTEQISNKDQKRRETLDRDVLTGKLKLIDTKILIEYIKDLYNLNSSCIPFNIRQDHLELFKRLLSAIVFMIFSSDDAVFVKEHYNHFLKARCYGFERHKAELIYLYELLIIKDNQNLVENLQNNSNLRHEEKNFNLEFYIENNIRLFIGKVKMRVFMKTFINFDENQNVLSFDYWKHLLQKTC